MDEFYTTVKLILQNNRSIFLDNSNTYVYLQEFSTRVNGVYFPRAFEYEISKTNKKRITIEYIHYLYKHWIETGRLLNRGEMLEVFPHEQCSRPCNYTVAKFIVGKL